MITSCIILNYNVADMTEDLVHSIEEYKNINYIVVVDNCSSDGSYERLKTLASDKIHVLKTGKNGGYGYGNNFGIKYSWENLNASRVLICNPDVKFSERCLAEMLTAMSKSKDIAVVSCIPYGIDGKRQSNGFWNLTSATGYALRTCTLYSTFSNNIFGSPDKYHNEQTEVKADCVVGSMLLLDTSLMLQSGMYDERMFLYCEETTLGIKLKKAGLKTIVLIRESYIHNHSISINKSINSLFRRRKIVVESKRIVITDYYCEKGIKLFFIKLILNYAIIEGALITFLSRLMNLLSLEKYK